MTDSQLEQLSRRLHRFAQERDWEQFHSPKNLAMALSVEAAELLEHFQWLDESQSASLDETKREAVALELADILMPLSMAMITEFDDTFMGIDDSSSEEETA